MARLLLPVLVLLIATCFLVLAVQAGEQGLKPDDELNAFRNHIKPGYCGSRCDYRCSKANLHKRCLKYCNICCAKCRCVPPGTAGNREACPCYDKIMNSRGGHKCP